MGATIFGGGSSGGGTTATKKQKQQGLVLTKHNSMLRDWNRGESKKSKVKQKED